MAGPFFIKIVYYVSSASWLRPGEGQESCLRSPSLMVGLSFQAVFFFPLFFNLFLPDCFHPPQ